MAAVVTAKGYDLVTSTLTSASTLPAVIGWGLNPNGISAASSDVALFQEAPDARISGGTVTVSVQQTVTQNDTVSIQGTVVCSQAAGETIAEVIVVDATTKPFHGTVDASSTVDGTTGGTSLVVHSGYTGTLPPNLAYLQLDTGEVVQVTAGGGTTSLTVARGANGSAANANAVGGGAGVGTNITRGAAPGQTPVGAQVLFHADFSGRSLTNGQSIQFTIQIQAI